MLRIRVRFWGHMRAGFIWSSEAEVVKTGCVWDRTMKDWLDWDGVLE